MQVGVVGHLEWVEFAVVPRLPQAGEIVEASDAFSAAAGGAAVAATAVREAAGEATLWTAVGDDEVGARAIAELRDERGLEVHAAVVAGRPTRRGFCHLAEDRERTITVAGERLAPAAADVDAGGYDGLYVTAVADEDALRAARAARVLVATPRTGDVLAGTDVRLDVVVASATDPGEQADPSRWATPPRAVVRTNGAHGGFWETAHGARGSWDATVPPGPPVDSYGCGDSFAGVLMAALAEGRPLADACARAAQAGARRLTLRGPYGRSARANAS